MRPECQEIILEHGWTDYLLEQALGHVIGRRVQEADAALSMARESLTTEESRRRLGAELVAAAMEGLEALPSVPTSESRAAARAIQQFRRIFWDRTMDRACQCEYGFWPPGGEA